MGITATLYAIYGSSMLPHLEDWRGKRAAFWDTAIRGSSCLRAALMRVLLAEVHAADGAAAAFAFSDFRAFYDLMGGARPSAARRA